MSTDWRALRNEIFEAFTPGPPINELALFAGRRDVIERLQDTTIERGRHAIIFGERGVGKTSLANIFHKDLSNSDRNAGIRTRNVVELFVNADSRDSFDSLWRKVFRRMKRDDSHSTIDLEYTGPIEPDHIILEMGKFTQNDLPMIIMDEYDRVEDHECRVLMTDVIKALTTVKTNPTLVLVGVADNILQLVEDHASISRNLVQIPMKRMSPSEIRDIITTRVRRLRMKISDHSILGPRTDISFIEAPRQRFVAGSAYLDDRPGAPMRFLAEANLTQIVRREEHAVGKGELRAQLNDPDQVDVEGDVDQAGVAQLWTRLRAIPAQIRSITTRDWAKAVKI